MYLGNLTGHVISLVREITNLSFFDSTNYVHNYS